MNTKRSLESDKFPTRPSFGRGTVIFIILFTLMCFLLARVMMQHHFLGGGRNNLQSPL